MLWCRAYPYLPTSTTPSSGDRTGTSANSGRWRSITACTPSHSCSGRQARPDHPLLSFVAAFSLVALTISHPPSANKSLCRGLREAMPAVLLATRQRLAVRSPRRPLPPYCCCVPVFSYQFPPTTHLPPRRGDCPLRLGLSRDVRDHPRAHLDHAPLAAVVPPRNGRAGGACGGHLALLLKVRSIIAARSLQQPPQDVLKSRLGPARATAAVLTCAIFGNRAQVVELLPGSQGPAGVLGRLHRALPRVRAAVALWTR